MDNNMGCLPNLGKVWDDGGKEQAEEEEQTDDKPVEVEIHKEYLYPVEEEPACEGGDQDGGDEKEEKEGGLGNHVNAMDTLPIPHEEGQVEKEGLESDDDNKGAHKVGEPIFFNI